MKRLIFLILFVLASVTYGQTVNHGIHNNRTPVPIKVEADGSTSVTIQDQTSRALAIRFTKLQEITSLALAAVVNDDSIVVANGATWSVGDILVSVGDDHVYFGQVIAKSVDTLWMDKLVDHHLELTDIVARRTLNMNVNGAITRQVFEIEVPTIVPFQYDVTRIIFSILDDAPMDDGLFGGLPALTRGVTFRLINGETNNYWNIKTNSDLALLSFDLTYADKAPAGQYGLRARITYAGQNKHGVAIRLKPGDRLEITIQDDLTGLLGFYIMSQGHIVVD